ncbi:hypothetical protein [uncultured Sphingomonas sp.]|uniref:hypothetical protein n=1 Tax=uncultured Sphingomonas sp. TaxID=158754 RepID=UPI0035CB8C36
MMRSAVLTAAALGLGSAAVAPAGQAPVPGPVKPKMICKRSADTGSLVARRRECRTRVDWDRIAEAARMGGQYEIDRQMTRPGGT